MEQDILEALEWKANDPTSQKIASLLLAVLEPDFYKYDLDMMSCLLDVATSQCGLAV